MVEYTHTHELIDNVPYLTMTILGGVIVMLSLNFSFLGWLTGVLFMLYGLVGTVWFIIFICPYCHFFGTRSCPCGYGQLAAKVRPKRDGDLFNEKFRRHIPVIFPLWIIPVLVGGIYIVSEFSQLMLVLLIVFIIDSYIILPLVSKKYGCAHCPQKDTCPWMGDGLKSARGDVVDG